MGAMVMAMMILMTLVKGREEKTATESGRVRENDAVGERTLGKEEKVRAKSEKEDGKMERKDVELKEKKGKGEKVQPEKQKEGGRGVKWDYVVLRKKPGGGKAARWDYTIERKGKRKAKAGGKTGKDETAKKKMEEVWDYSMEINSPE